jgi:energy-coupling factor transporter transmembrane protein EcfT
VRIKLVVTLGALVLALGAHHPATPLGIAACALASLLCTARAEGGRRTLGALATLAFTAGVPVALLAWLRGVEAATLVGARVLAAVSAGLWLTSGARASELQRALLWLRVPRPLVELLGLAHRHVAVFREVFDTALEAQRMRLGWVGRARSLRSAGILAGVVFGRAIDQAGLLGEALALRGYRGELPLERPGRFQRADAWLALGAAVALLGCALLPGLSAATGRNAAALSIPRGVPPRPASEARGVPTPAQAPTPPRRGPWPLEGAF